MISVSNSTYDAGYDWLSLFLKLSIGETFLVMTADMSYKAKKAAQTHDCTIVVVNRIGGQYYMALTKKGNLARKPTAIQRFFAKIDCPGQDCWEWQAGMTRVGYGAFAIVGCAGIPAHRAAWTLLRGPIPEGIFVCHHCDNRKCVNPDHLFLGTHLDNMRDMVAKGRSIPRRQMFCKRGHPRSGDNLYISPGGWHQCRACMAFHAERRLKGGK